MPGPVKTGNSFYYPTSTKVGAPTPENLKDIKSKVKDVEAHEPGHMVEAWDSVSADNYISKEDKARLDKAMGDVRLFGFELKDGSDTVESRFVATRLAEKKGIKWDPEVEAAYKKELAGREKRLESGEILSGSFVTGRGAHQLTEGIIDQPFDDYTASHPLGDWAKNMGEGYRGGEAVDVKKNEQGQVISQRQRMVTETPVSGAIRELMTHDALPPGLKDACKIYLEDTSNGGLPNDMEKWEVLEYKYDDNGKLQEEKVSWEVIHSKNGSTIKDLGGMSRKRTEDGKVRMTWESEHEIDLAPSVGLFHVLGKTNDQGFSKPLKVYNTIIASSLEGFFTSATEGSRE